MCAHLSDRENWTNTDKAVAVNFRKYTGRSPNPRNIAAAFSNGDERLYSSSCLEEKLADRLSNAKRHCKGIRSARLSAYARDNPGWCEKHGIKL